MPAAAVPDLRLEGPLSDLWRGATLPFRAAPLLLHPRLARLTALSAAVTAVSLVAVGWGSYRLSHWLAAWLTSTLTTLHSLATLTLTVALWLVTFAVGALTVPGLLLAPLQDPLSQATEQLCLPPGAAVESEGGFLPGTLESLRHTLGRLLLVGAGLTLLFPLNLVPVIGNGLWVVLSTAWSAFWVAAEQLSNPMARHLRPFGEVVATLRARPALALGFGASLTIILWVPVVNFFLTPLAVVAGTLLYRGLEAGNAPLTPVVALS